jgi:hypothetical protein
MIARVRQGHRDPSRGKIHTNQFPQAGITPERPTLASRDACRRRQTYLIHKSRVRYLIELHKAEVLVATHLSPGEARSYREDLEV